MKPSFNTLACVIFDFDGVILDSSGLKTECFRALYRQYPEVYEPAMGFHFKNKGLSRHKQFDHIARNLMRASDPDNVIREMADRFACIVFEEVLKAPFIPGAREFLDLLHERIPMYVISSSPADELDKIVEARLLSGYFKAWYGSVDSKEVYLKEILALENLPPENVLFIGDTRRDLMAATAAGVPFCGIQNALTDFSPEECFSVSDFNELIPAVARDFPLPASSRG